MNAKGIHFNEEPDEETYGFFIMFEDLYRNKWDLVERKNQLG